MKKQSIYIVGVLMVLCLFLPKPILAAKAIKLTYANFPPAPTFPCVQMERWKQEVEKRSGGRLAVQTFPGGTLLGAKNMFDGIVMGQADIGCFAMSYHPGRFPLAEAVDLPLGWPNATVASLTLWDLHKKYQPESFKKVKVLTMFTCPPANIMSIDPVRSLDDLKGLEIRAAGTGVKIFELLGASPIGMPQSDVPDALHKKVIKGMASSLEVMSSGSLASEPPQASGRKAVSSKSRSTASRNDIRSERGEVLRMMVMSRFLRYLSWSRSGHWVVAPSDVDLVRCRY